MQLESFEFKNKRFVGKTDVVCVCVCVHTPGSFMAGK